MAKILVHQVLIYLRRCTADKSERKARFRARSRLHSQNEYVSSTLDLCPEVGSPPQRRHIFQACEEPFGEATVDFLAASLHLE